MDPLRSETADSLQGIKPKILRGDKSSINRLCDNSNGPLEECLSAPKGIKCRILAYFEICITPFIPHPTTPPPHFFYGTNMNFTMRKI